MARSTDTDDDTVPEAPDGEDRDSDDLAPADQKDQGDQEDQDDQDDDQADDEDELPARSDATDELWEEVSIDPIRIALPREKVGYTLRAYRPRSQLDLPEVAIETEDDPFAAREAARAAEDAALEEALAAEAIRVDEDDEELAAEDTEVTAEDEEDGEEEADEEADEEAEADEDVPVFLSHEGRLLLFATPESLVSFLSSGAPHQLTQLDTWSTLVKRVRVEDIVATEEDTYELDLVVENLRGGHDAWDALLLVGAAELARDLGFALRLEPVLTALAPGSPLDDLDEALRAAEAGWLSGLLAKRRLRRIGAQQASLGWRTIIGKISAAVDWRD